jgi:PAS domain S-box-containing protein
MTEAFPDRLLCPLPLPANEAERLEALRRYEILDTPPEVAFDRITTLAARLFDVPIALVSLVDESRAWFKSCYGFELQEVQRDDTICSFALLYDGVLVVPDARQDDRFACNPFVQAEPGLRFYAGAPLLTQDGFNLGTLCLLAMEPRPVLTDGQQATLSDLAAMVVDELELRLAARRIAQIDTALLEVTQSVATATGEAFFPALVQQFTKTLGIDYAYIGLVSGDRQDTIRTIATCANGKLIDNFEYQLAGTPCQEVIQTRKLCCYPSGVQTRFPRAPLLAPLQVDSYAAIPFFNSTGAPLGLLGIMDGKPLANLQLAESLLTIFALRVATELERQQAEIARQQAQQELERLVEQRTVELSQANELLRLEIAERQQAEVALQKEQETLKVLLDNVQAGIVACNAEGILTLFNQAAREFHGLPEQPLPSEQWADHYDLYRPDGTTPLPQAEIPLFRALQGETIYNVEMMIVPKQGVARTLLASGQAIVDAHGQKQGAVVIMHDITDRKQAEEERAQLVREQAARAMAEVSQERAAFLAEVSSVLASSLEYEQTLQSVANLAVPYFADWCSVDLLNEDGSISRVAVKHSDPEKVKLGWRIAERYPRHLNDGFGVSKVMQTGQSEIALSLTDEQLVAAIPNADYLEIVQNLGLKSCIVTPLTVRGRVLGSMSFVFSESDRHYTMADLDLAEDLTRRAAMAIDNARLFQETQQSQRTAEQAADRTARLQAVTAALSKSLTPRQVADVIVEQSMLALAASSALVALLTDDQTELEIVNAIGYEPDLVEDWRRFPLNADVPLAEVVRTGEPAWLAPLADRLQRYPHLAEIYSRYDFKAWMSLPLTIEGKTFGGILLSFQDYQPQSQDDRDFIVALTQQCAQAISRAQLYEAERKARADAEQANQVKDEFLAVLSHELRSPLNPILGWSKLLQTKHHDPVTLTRGLQTIERNAKLQTQLIEDLLDVSRILRGKLSLEMIPVDLKPTIEAAIETVRLTAEARAIELKFEVSQSAAPQRRSATDSSTPPLIPSSTPSPIQVLGDAGRLQQVIWNLLSNAVKFTPNEGKVEIRLQRKDGGEIQDEMGTQPSSVIRSIEPHGRGPLPSSLAEITVTDTGKGITPDFLPYIFDRFRQADSKTTRKFGGLGLGLAIARHLVEQHGGTIQVSSPGEGLGATFTVKLPLWQADDQQKKTTSGLDSSLIPASSSSPLTGLRILVVDDETDARELLVFILERAGAIVTPATSAIEALQTLATLEVGVVISDIGMPDMDGYMLMQQMTAQFANKKAPNAANRRQPPAIALTAYAGELNQQKALAAGFKRHLTKPVEPEELVNTIVELTLRQSV